MIISSIDDPTAAHFFEFCMESVLPASWITYEDLLSASLTLREVQNAVYAASGIYLREKEELNEADSHVCALVRALVDSTANVIRPSELSTNWCKPYHALSLRKLVTQTKVPQTLLTSESPPRFGGVLKNCSALPCYVFSSEDENLQNSHFAYIWQERVKGTEVRVHVLDGSSFSVAIKTDSIDYRKSMKFEFEEIKIDACLSEELNELCLREGLRFSGIDIFLRGADVFVIEINPMPGYHTFDVFPAHSISRALYASLQNTG